ncbi:MAG TPA: non-homologous end-joining DNA ligase [Burkholderiales bacterium]|nr:non-homologous end-joining DNA ligase [Burkholderiales bacterium]
MNTSTTQARSVSVHGVAITHGDRPVWPGITKLELARYYEAVADWLLPHLARRPLTLVRCPDGVSGECFYQRHLLMAASPGAVKSFKRERGSRAPYMYVDSMDAVISAVQNGAVEFHTSGATIPDVAHPDRFTLDLDPGPEVSWTTLVDAATLTKAFLDTLNLQSFVKTTGGNGLHVVVPVEPELDWPAITEFTRDIARSMEKARPDLFVAHMAKSQRQRKVFVDYLRNSGEIRTAVAAYSARTRPGATVSLPIAWEELRRNDLRGAYTVHTVVKRLAHQGSDPWAAYGATRQSITERMRHAVRAMQA